MKNKVSLFTVISVALVFLFMLALTLALFEIGRPKPSPEENMSRDTIESIGDGDMLNLLFCGRDDGAGLADVIILASVDMRTGDTNVLQIPRDTYFAYTDADYKKINGAPHALGSTESFARKLSEALGTEIDHYLSLDLSTVSDIVDMISGVEVDIPFDMDYEDPAQELSIHLKAGRQTLDGETALKFVRYRSGYVTGDIGRMDAQKLFLNAFCEKIKKIGNPILFYKMFKLVTSRADTDISQQTMIELALDGIGKKGSISYVTLPGEAVQSERSGAWYYIISRESAAQLLKSRFGMEQDEKDFDKANKFVDKTQKSFYDIYSSPREYIVYGEDEVKNNLKSIN